MPIFNLHIKDFLIRGAEEVDIIIKEEEVAELTTMDLIITMEVLAITMDLTITMEVLAITVDLTTTMEVLVIPAIILPQGNILSHKIHLANLSQIGHSAKSVERVVTQPLIATTEWILHIKGGMPLLSWLQWWLTHLKCSTAMASSLIQAAQIMSLLICPN